MSEKFQMDEYMKKVLDREEDPLIRQGLGRVLAGVLEPLERYVTAQYDAVREKVLEEEWKQEDGFTVYTAMVKKEDFDLQVNHLYPMDPDDLFSRTIETKRLLTNLSTSGNYYLYSIFVTGEYPVVCELTDTYRRFHGTVITNEEEYPAYFEIKRDTHYLDKIHDLYCTFMDNGLEWRTVCAPHLFRAFQVYLVETECPEDEEIQSIYVDFEEYEELIMRDMVPVWNVTKIVEVTSAYPVPSMEQLQFEHVIYKHRLHEDCRYLPKAQELQLLGVREKNGDLMITCTESKPVRWELYEFWKWEKQPVEFTHFHNGFVKRGTGNSSFSRIIKTKAQLRHLIGMLGYEEKLRFMDAEVVERKDEKGYDWETYSMDSFIEDEIRTGKPKQVLILKFQPVKQGATYNYDWMSYLVSRVQWIYPEYYCVGTFRFVKKQEE